MELGAGGTRSMRRHASCEATRPAKLRGGEARQLCSGRRGKSWESLRVKRSRRDSPLRKNGPLGSFNMQESNDVCA